MAETKISPLAPAAFPAVHVVAGSADGHSRGRDPLFGPGRRDAGRAPPGQHGGGRVHPVAVHRRAGGLVPARPGCGRRARPGHHRQLGQRQCVHRRGRVPRRRAHRGIRGRSPGCAGSRGAGRLHRRHRRGPARRAHRRCAPGTRLRPLRPGPEVVGGSGRRHRHHRHVPQGCVDSSGRDERPCGRHRQGQRHDRPRHGHHAGVRVHRPGRGPAHRPAVPGRVGGEELQPHHRRLRHLHQRHRAAGRNRHVGSTRRPAHGCLPGTHSTQ